jgi:hypothetical protein
MSEPEKEPKAAPDPKAAEAPRPRFNRYDYTTALKPPVRTQEGYLRVDGRIARIGVQEYRDGSGAMRRELRLPEEVFDAESLASFNLLPVTNQHPPTLLNAENARRFAVGALGDIRIDENKWVVGSMLIHDKEAIADAEAGRSQLSNGYSCELDETGGEWNGERYDSIQRKIRGNHCALVSQARAGSEARLRLDASDAVAGDPIVEAIDPKPLVSNKKELADMSHTLRVDNLEFTVSDPNAQVAVDRALANVRKQCEDEIASHRSRADASAKLLADVQKNLATATGERDALEAQIRAQGMEKIKFDDTEITIADLRDETKRQPFFDSAVDRASAVRAALIAEARPFLGARLDGLSNIAIKKLVIAKLDPGAKLDGQSDEYIHAAYDTIMRFANKGKPRPIDRVREIVTTAAPSDAPRADVGDNPDEARERMMARQRAAFVK